jgi:hypothetical protein
MHRDILTAKQVKLLPLIREFSRDYYLVGGTAIALYLGHRRSIDFVDRLVSDDEIKYYLTNIATNPFQREI